MRKRKIRILLLRREREDRHRLKRSINVGERSLSPMSNSTKGLLNQHATTREEVDATRLLGKHSTSKLVSPTRQSDSAPLMKLIPDLSQKEMSRLVGAIIKRQKRDATSVRKKQATARERSVLNTVPSLFPEKTPVLHEARRTRLRCLLAQQLHRRRKHSRCYASRELRSKEQWIMKTDYIATWI